MGQIGIYKSEECKNELTQCVYFNKLEVKRKSFCAWCNKEHEFVLREVAEI